MKIVFNLCIFLCFCAVPKIQSQSILGVEVGYGFPWAGDEVSDGNITFISQGLREIDVINWSFGAGRNYSISFSHFLTASIEAKCMVSYLDGSSVSRTLKFSNSTVSSNYKSNAFWLSPTLIFNLGKKRVRPYAYAGVVFGVGPRIIDDRKSVSDNGISESRYVFSGGSVFGISSGIGFKFYLKKNTKWYFSTEARLISASYSPKKGELVRDNIDGMDVSNWLPTNQKKAIYKDRYIVDESVPENPNEPAIYPRKVYPFSSLGLNFGIFYTL